ncbi:MAG: hypothetical protein KDA17_06410, partial [Candidatus Saccharibacteria bacterium]|nr:hypothetical protein [Candidatus Saccharibacteria bacterium]
RPEYFKLVRSALGTPIELWMKTPNPYVVFSVYELGGSYTGTITYYEGASWVVDEPVGANFNVVSTGPEVMGAPIITTTGTQTMTNKTLTNPQVNTICSTNNVPALLISAPASSVNYLAAYGNPTGNPVYFGAAGSDTNIPLYLSAKGTGSAGVVNIGNNGGNGLQIITAASTANNISVYSAATGVAPSVYATGTDTNVDMNLTTKGSGVVRANGAEVATISGAQTLSNKTMNGASNTITNLPASATPDAARKVWTSLSTVSGQWTKVLTYTPGNTTLDRISLCLSFVSFAHNTSAIVALEAGITSNTSSASIELLSKAAGTALGADSFKIISDGSGAAFELWIKAYNNGSAIVVSEISRYTHVGTLAYTPGVAFQGTVPTGASVNAQTSSVTAGGAPVVTTTGTQTLTN